MMEKFYNKSMKMIRELDIKSEEEYNKLLKNFLILSSESLKYICKTRDFNKIIEMAKNRTT